MTDFEMWMEEQASRQDTDGSLRMFRDLADLTAQLYDAASPFGALQDKATNPRVGLTQPVTVAEAEALNDALQACKEFMDRYGQ